MCAGARTVLKTQAILQTCPTFGTIGGNLFFPDSIITFTIWRLPNSIAVDKLRTRVHNMLEGQISWYHRFCGYRITGIIRCFWRPSLTREWTAKSQRSYLHSATCSCCWAQNRMGSPGTPAAHWAPRVYVEVDWSLVLKRLVTVLLLVTATGLPHIDVLGTAHWERVDQIATNHRCLVLNYKTSGDDSKFMTHTQLHRILYTFQQTFCQMPHTNRLNIFLCKLYSKLEQSHKKNERACETAWKVICPSVASDESSLCYYQEPHKI